MLEVASYGLTGLAAVVVMASCLAYRDEFSLWRKRPVNGMNRRNSPVSLRAGQRNADAFYGGVSSKSVPREAFHG
jgi:hypothetical protein